MAENGHLSLRGKLEGHNGWVTSLATTVANPKLLLSGSRDKTLVAWDLTGEQVNYGVPKRVLQGHSNFVSDCALSNDGQFAMSSSWDRNLRLWNLSTGETKYTLSDHSKDVLSVAFSADNTKIISGGRDKAIKLWNTLGECKHTIVENGHSEWISCVRFSPNIQSQVIVSGGWDRLVKVWNLSTCKLMTNLIGHQGVVNTVCVSPDGSLCASGGKDGTAMLWDLVKGEHLYSLEAGETINGLAFSPSRYWLCAATPKSVKIWDLESKKVVADLKPETKKEDKSKAKPECLSVAWSADGNTLFSGYSDGAIRVWGVLSH